MNKKLRIITLEKINDQTKEVDTIRVGWQFIRHYNNIKSSKKAVSQKEANLYKSFFWFIGITITLALLFIPFSLILRTEETWAFVIYGIVMVLYLVIIFAYAFWYEFNSGKIILYEKLINGWKPYSQEDLDKIKDVYEFYNWDTKKELKYQDIKLSETI